MKIKNLIKSIIIFIAGALSVIGYQKMNRFMKIDKCLDNGGRWNYEMNECEFIRNKLKLMSNFAYEVKIENNDVSDFIRNYTSEVANESISPFVLILNVQQINDGIIYTIHCATHEIHAELGQYSYEEKNTTELEPQHLYAIVDEHIVLIKSGIEKLNPNLNRYEYILELTSPKLDRTFVTRTPDKEGYFESDAPSTQHLDYWRMYECDNSYEVIKFDNWGQILNNRNIPDKTFCNHLGDNENLHEPIKPPNENYQ